MTDVWQDLRFAARMLRKSPGLTLVAALTLALGVGANTAIFTVVNAVLIRPLPYPRAGQVVQLWETDREKGGQSPLSPLDFRDWQQQNRTFAHLALYGYNSYNLTGAGQPQRIVGSDVSADFFAVLGVAPALGRVFTPAEDTPGGRHAIVLSHGFWLRQFGGQRDVLGRTLTLDGQGYTVVGVMPADFTFPETGVDLWTPLGLDYGSLTRGSHFVLGIGRLREGVSLARARQDLATVARRLEDQYPATNTRVTARLVPLRAQLVGNVRRALLILLAAVGLVLLIASANVANLLIVRATTRRAEIAIRRALGAGTGRLLRQFLVEALLLALVGGVAGVLVAVWGVDGLVSLNRQFLPRIGPIAPDGRVLLFALGTLVFITLLLGLVQVATLSGQRETAALREGGRGGGSGPARQRFRAALTIAQIGMTLPLLAGTGLLLQTLVALQRVSPGFRADHLLTMNVTIPAARYPTAERQTGYIDGVLNEVHTVPGVLAAGMNSDLPFSGSRTYSTFEIVGRPAAAAGEGPAADARAVSPEYFRAMGIPLLRGRGLAPQDRAGAPGVVLINQALAERYFPQQDPLGKQLIILGQSREIVGIVGNVRHDDLRASPGPEYYVPLAQEPSTRLFLAVRAAGDPHRLAAAVTRAVHEVDPDEAVFAIRTMQERLTRSLATQRSTLGLLGLFAALALVLAIIGLYGVISFGVAQRARELGIRLAVGAQPRDVLRLMLGQSTRLVAAGLVLGIVAAFATTRALASLLFAVPPADPRTLIAVSALLGFASLVACWVPARRATRTDPMAVLRSE